MINERENRARIAEAKAQRAHAEAMQRTWETRAGAIQSAHEASGEAVRKAFASAYRLGLQHGRTDTRRVTLEWVAEVVRELAAPGKSGAALEADFQRWVSAVLGKDRRS